MPKIVVTGGPGVGKTTLIDELVAMGYAAVEEVARDIKEMEMDKAKTDPSYIPILPETDQEGFNALVVAEQLLREENVKARPVILDRCLVDPIAYAELSQANIFANAVDLVNQAGYHHKVLMLEPLGSYQQDKERPETEDQSRAIHEHLRAVYTRMGFKVVSVPSLPIPERVSFVLNHISLECGSVFAL